MWDAAGAARGVLFPLSRALSDRNPEVASLFAVRFRPHPNLHIATQRVQVPGEPLECEAREAATDDVRDVRLRRPEKLRRIGLRQSALIDDPGCSPLAQIAFYA